MADSTTLLERFAQFVDGHFDPDDIASFWRCAPAFRELIDGDVAGGVVNEELRRLRDNPSYIGNWQAQQLVLHKGPAYAVSMSLLERTRRYIHSASHFAMIAPLGAPLRYDVYAYPEGFRNDVFDPAVRLTQVDSGEIAANGVLEMHSDRHVYDFHVDRPLMQLRFTTSPFETMEWLFNRETLYAWQANDAELKSTQTRVAAYLLGRLAHPSSLEPLEQLTQHPHHAVRWAAIQSIGRLSRTAAMNALQRATEDPHPHIRRAAEKALGGLKRKD